MRSTESCLKGRETVDEIGQRVLQSFFLIVPFYFSLILVVYLRGEVDVFTPIRLFLFIRTLSSFSFFDLSMDLTNS